MFIYILIIALSLIILVQSGFLPAYKRNRQSKVGVLLVLIIVFIGTFRDTTIGTDIGLSSRAGYYIFFLDPFKFGRELEIGFKYFTILIKSLSSSYYFYYSLIFILNILFYSLACRKLRIGFPLFMAILFMSSLLTPSFNVIRQMLGLSIGLYLYSILYYQKEKNVQNVLKYVLSILILGVTIHNSLVVLSVIPIIDIPVIKKYFSKTWFLCLLAFGSVLLSKYGANLIASNVIRFTGVFGERADLFIDVVENYDIERTHGYLTDAINFTLIIILSKINRNNFFIIGFIGYIFSCISAATLGAIGRAFDNLIIFTCLYYAQNWNLFITRSETKTVPIVAMLLRMIFWFTSLYFTVLYNDSICPYKSYLF